MTERIIVENRTKLPMNEVLPYVGKVIADGRISNNNTQYCYVNVWQAAGITVCADKNKKSDRFIVTNKGGKGESA